MPMNFYPRSPCGERHGPAGRGDPAGEFLSTLSLRRATRVGTTVSRIYTFLSTLSLRRATSALQAALPVIEDFYPRSPCGERPIVVFRLVLSHVISIHALLAESDIMFTGILPHHAHFYPRSPCGERRYSLRHSASRWHFYPRSPCGERQTANGLADTPPHISIHALLAESDARRITAE